MSGKSKFETRINAEIDKEEVLAAANKIKAYCESIDDCSLCCFEACTFFCGFGDNVPEKWDIPYAGNNQGDGE